MAEDAYERGVAAGEISARLAGHDAHFALINGSLIEVAAEMKTMNLQLQRMTDAMQADRERAVATATALREADEARRVTGERHWTPLTRLAVLATTLAALAGVAAFLITTFHLPDRRPIVAVGTNTGRAPVEAKAQAAGIAGGAAGVVLWVLQTYVFKGTAVPAGLVSLVDVAVPGILALAGAYLAPHTPRPLPPVPAPPAAPAPPAGPAA